MRIALRSNGAQRRHGGTVVEMAVVISIFLVFIFAIVEYARFVFLLQVMNNAAREGARYAVVRTDGKTTATEVSQEVTDRMVGQQVNVAPMTIEVENVDPNTGTVVPGNWYDSGFGQAIRVRVKGTYRPMLPTFLLLPNAIPVEASAMMASESN